MTEVHLATTNARLIAVSGPQHAETEIPLRRCHRPGLLLAGMGCGVDVIPCLIEAGARAGAVRSLRIRERTANTARLVQRG